MKIIEMRGENAEFVEAVANKCIKIGYKTTFLDRLTLQVENNGLIVCLWFGRPEGNTKTVALNKLDKELSDG